MQFYPKISGVNGIKTEKRGIDLKVVICKKFIGFFEIKH